MTCLFWNERLLFSRACCSINPMSSWNILESDARIIYSSVPTSEKHARVGKEEASAHARMGGRLLAKRSGGVKGGGM